MFFKVSWWCIGIHQYLWIFYHTYPPLSVNIALWWPKMYYMLQILCVLSAIISSLWLSRTKDCTVAVEIIIYFPEINIRNGIMQLSKTHKKYGNVVSFFLPELCLPCRYFAHVSCDNYQCQFCIKIKSFNIWVRYCILLIHSKVMILYYAENWSAQEW